MVRVQYCVFISRALKYMNISSPRRKAPLTKGDLYSIILDGMS